MRATAIKGARIYLPYWLGLTIAKMASWFGRLAFGPTAKLPGLLVPIRYQARFRPLRFTSQKAQTRLGWRPRWSFAEAWQRASKSDVDLRYLSGESDKSLPSPKEVAID
jgi:hypothetical protein